MHCPKCQATNLEAATISGINVDRCPSCRGAWFDPDELARLLSVDKSELKPLTGGSMDASANARTGNCPREGTKLVRIASPKVRQVVLDVCPQCRGVWLDGGEFTRLKEE